MTEWRTPFELRPGDRIAGRDLTVTDVSGHPATLGGALLAHGDTEHPHLPGDHYSVGMRRPDGTRTGISGTWDGDSGFLVTIRANLPSEAGSFNSSPW